MKTTYTTERRCIPPRRTRGRSAWWRTEYGARPNSVLFSTERVLNVLKPRYATSIGTYICLHVCTKIDMCNHMYAYVYACIRYLLVGREGEAHGGGGGAVVDVHEVAEYTPHILTTRTRKAHPYISYKIKTEYTSLCTKKQAHASSSGERWKRMVAVGVRRTMSTR